MKRSFPRLVSVLVLTFTIVFSFAYFVPAHMLRPVAAQSTSLSGSYGFVGGVAQIDSAGANGGAFLGVMNFDGAGNVTGTSVIKPRDTRAGQAQPMSSTTTGTYSTNADGTGSITLNFDVGFATTLVFVTVDGGQGLQLIDGACSACTADVPFRGQAPSVSGGLPIQYFIPNATGNIPVTLTAVTSTAGGSVLSAAAPTAATNGSGTAKCDDGSTGNWTAAVPALTIIVNPPISNNASIVSGNYLASIFGTFCGRPDFETLSGLVTGNVAAGGATTLLLHATGSAFSGTGRAMKGGSLSGSYGVQFDYSPFPFASVGVMKFDGAGSVDASLMGAGPSGPATTTFTGTYSTNSDGTGTINLKNASGQAGPTFAFVSTDGGSQFLFLRTDANPGFDVAWGTARQQ